MEYPHRRYLLYLLSRRLTDGEIFQACTTRSLVLPSENDLRSLRKELGGIPSYWRSDLGPTNTRLYRWLRDLEVLALWRESKVTRKAVDFLYATDGKSGPRKDFEHLMLLEWDVRKTREQMVIKYGELRIPKLEALECFSHFFWNLREMSQAGIFNYLEVQGGEESRLAAFAGDLSATYGLLGIRQRVEEEAFYDDLIALAHSQVQRARQSPETLNGTQIMGISALARVADDAIQQRRDLHKADLGDTIRSELAAFRLRKRSIERGIPSYERLLAQEAEEENVIDVVPQLVKSQ